MPRRLRAAESTAVLQAERVGIFAFETFVEGLDFLSSGERNRMRLAGGEIFDNLIRHASPLEDEAMTVRAAKRNGQLYLFFFFKASFFAAYASRCGDFQPIYDRGSKRWSGMGLRMCRNLSRSLRMRAGGIVDRIIMTF